NSPDVAIHIESKRVSSDAKELLAQGVELQKQDETIREISVEIATSDEDVIRALEAAGYTQDPDVLDTWFSSWLWPFATMDEATRKKFYPTTALVSGPDILF